MSEVPDRNFAKPRSARPGIPQPTASNLLDTVLSIKEAVETINGQRRGSRVTSAVTWEDLIALGIVTLEQVPK